MKKVGRPRLNPKEILTKTGIALSSADLAYLKQLDYRGEGSISGAVRWLIEQHRARYIRSWQGTEHSS